MPSLAFVPLALAPTRWRRLRGGVQRKLMGVAFLIVVALLLGLTVAVYNKTFVKIVPVTLQASSTGNQLNLGADVKVRGLIVGEVRSIKSNGSRATLKLALQPGKVGDIPDNVHARILPKTLFGEKYVNLVIPPQPSAKPIAAHDVITEDRSSTAIETEKVLNDLMPLLRTVQPEKLNETFSALADALSNGRGEELGATLAATDDYLKEFNKHLPALSSDISGLADLADTLNTAEPDLVAWLSNIGVTMQTLAQKSDTLASFLRGTAGFADITHDVLAENESRLISLASTARPVLQTIENDAAYLPPTFNGLAQLAPMFKKVFGTGPNRNWLHIKLILLPPKGAYQAPRDCPRYGSMAGPNCGSSPAQTAADGSAATPLTTSQLAAGGGAGVGPVGSSQEKQALDEILGPMLRAQGAPDTVPDIADLLVGPMLRGSEVSVG
jgi:phospholipid/cholesterol/gamma-HCH transport system substrate-binding protein